MTTTESARPTAAPRPPAQHGGLYRFLFVHEIDEYPTGWTRAGYLALAIVATVVLYYTYYTQTGVTPNILAGYHMSFAFYVGIVIVSNLIGAFASLPASRTDQVGRSNVVIYGLLLVGLIVAVWVPNAGSQWNFAAAICTLGLVEGAILVATPALVRDFSPQLGRASAMGFWTVGPVAGSLIVSIVARNTLDHFVDWQSQFIISGISALAVFVLSLFFLCDLSSRIRDQLMVSTRDRTLVEARARGLTDKDIRAATASPWRQILKWDLIGSAFGIAVFLLIYYVAASFFTIYYVVTFKNPNGTSFSTTQANGLNVWFWTADIIALIVVGVLSDWARVRKPFMLFGAIGSMVMLILFGSRASHPYTGYYTLAILGALLAVFLSFAFAPWMAGYTETIESKNPALVATGLALWGWILRVVVGISFIFLPIVINTVNPVVDNQALATSTICKTSTSPGTTAESFNLAHPQSVAFAQKHAALLTKVQANAAVVNAVAAAPTPANIVAATKALGAKDFAELVALQKPFIVLVKPYQCELSYLAKYQTQLTALQNGLIASPKQWQRWFWVDFAGMVVFVPLIWLTRGRWSPKKARQDEAEHARLVDEELAALQAEHSTTTTSA
ncbi:MAG TPA: MFS transporter [Acidimicrobiales bacterium]|nr:MFS transporter [Acidimicrobiales bacterium]